MTSHTSDPEGADGTAVQRLTATKLPQTHPLLALHALKVAFRTDKGLAKAVDGVSLDLHPNETLAIVGESGSGKSALGRAILGLNGRDNVLLDGRIMFDGLDLLQAAPGDIRRLRGTAMSMIYQDPLASLHPFYKIGWQVQEALRGQPGATRQTKRKQVLATLARVGLPDPPRIARSYPHELSGGMRQRVMIAMALISGPRLLIADEPTTALDVTVQAQVLALIAELKAELGMGVILITHDLGVAAEVARNVLVMYAGQVMESGPIDTILSSPAHPYTWGLLKSLTRIDRPVTSRLEAIPGVPPSATAIPPGCPFHPRCPYTRYNAGRCQATRPDARVIGVDHRIACHLADTTRRQIYDAEVGPRL